MEMYNNHKRLFGLAILLFLGLTMFVAIIPAFTAEQNNAPLPNSQPLSKAAMAGKGIFISEGCIGCHTQQVRNVEMDQMWGSRPSIAADYARITRTDVWRNTAMLMGSERTGPDLTSIGTRQSSKDWQLLHLYNPRAVVAQSIMPSYEWLFEVKEYPMPEDVVVNVPDGFRKGTVGKIVATPRALELVAYLQSLKQTPLPDGKPVPVFLYPKVTVKATSAGTAAAKPDTGPDGAALYATNCQSCHQSNGEGLKGAFPPLKGSPVVLDKDPTVQITIILKGYNGRASEGYGEMPPVGTNNNLKPEEIAAIINHERSSWGNNSKKVTVAEVNELFNQVKKGTNAKK